MSELKSFLGMGVYTVPEAAYLTGVNSRRIRRWLDGYKFKTGDKVHVSPPVWKHDLPSLEDRLALSFRDLMEVRFVNYFIEQGVGWKELRECAKEAAEVVKDSHPFSTRRFKTDGRTIFYEYAKRTGDKTILKLIEQQYEIPQVVEPYLYEGLQFDQKGIIRWFPLSPSQRIVIDPAIAFGRPVTNPEGVPTRILARCVKAEESVEAAAEWYCVDVDTVVDAVRYEQSLLAA